MKTLNDRILAFILGTSLIAASCGGGASFGGGIGGTGLVVGPITDFGSVIVEGVEFDTSAAIVTIDGQPATPADLALGMVVTVQGEIDSSGTTGVADTVEFTSLIEGPVTDVDLASKTATVLGQTVRVDADTVLDRIAPDVSAIPCASAASSTVTAPFEPRGYRGGRPGCRSSSPEPFGASTSWHAAFMCVES